jgi:hypothetical protein
MKSTTVFVLLLGIILAATCNADDRQGAEEDNLPAPWFGATPPKKQYEMHRRGWDACLRCGGAERLGATVNIGNLTDLDDEGAMEILDAVRAHGIVVIKAQNLTRGQQVQFTSKLGEVIVLPHSFEGKDPEPFHPAVQRVTNFWANNTWVRTLTFSLDIEGTKGNIAN